jgi:hypothetical protein
MTIMTWLFAMPAFAMMFLFATFAANEGFEHTARRRLHALLGGNVRRESRAASRGRRGR